MRLAACRPAAPIATLALALVVAGSMAACGGAVGAPVATAVPASGSASSSAASPVPASPGASSAEASAPVGPTLTPVPGGETVGPDPGRTPIPTTVTDWGTILDDLPPGFPMIPDAGVADVEDGPYSGTFDAPVDVASAAAWYRDELTNRGYGVDSGSPLEDGSVVLDAQADLPECRIQMTFRPGDGSTIITVLVASACATGVEG